jgi:hypothetical protein
MNRILNNIKTNSFFKKNLFINYIYVMMIISVATFAPILNTVLINEYKITNENLSMMQSFLLIGFLLSNIIHSRNINKNKNIINILIFSIILFLASIITETIFLKDKIMLNENFIYFCVLRMIDGFSSFIFVLTINHIISLKLLVNKYRDRINSIYVSINQVSRVLLPICVAYFLTTTTSSNLFVISIIINISIVIVIIYKRKFLFIKLTKILKKNTKEKNLNITKEIKLFFSKDMNIQLYQRMYYLIVYGMLTSFVLSFSNLLLPLILVKKYGFDTAETTLILSVMIGSIGIQFLLTDLMKSYSLKHLLSLVFTLLLVVFFIFLTKETLTLIEAILIAIILGLSRVSKIIWEFSYRFKHIIKDHITLQNTNLVTSTTITILELGNYLIIPYLIINNNFDEILELYIGVLFILLIIHLFFSIYAKKKIK